MGCAGPVIPIDPAPIAPARQSRGDTASGTVRLLIADPGAGVLHVRRGLGCTGTWSEYSV